MNYLSIQFAFFLAAAVLGYYLCPERWRPAWLLVASYAFYCFWSPLAAVGILGATVVTFCIGLLIGRIKKNSGLADSGRRLMAAGVALLLTYLTFYKAAGPLSHLLSQEGKLDWWTEFLARNSLLPLGISYYSFKLISYLVDVYWEKIPAETDLVDFATYVAFFPQIVAGPIQRSGDFLAQIRKPSISEEMLVSGLRRMLLGCFKKTVIADNLALLVNLAYTHSAPSSASTLVAFYIFPLQLYMDFSALTDIAVGTARLFGIQSPENFNAPFSASSISQYWRRWHMSLTTWLLDYVFLPLRMATRRAGNWGLAFSLIVNMVLIGLWHGLSWTFAVFGFLHGCFLLVDALTAKTRASFFKMHADWVGPGDWVGRIFTFHLVAFAMVFFRAESLTQAFDFLARLSANGLWASGLLDKEAIYGLAGLALLTLGLTVKKQRGSSRLLSPVWARWAFYYAVIAIIAKYGRNADGFIYFKF